MIGAGDLDRRVQFRRSTLVDEGSGMAEQWADRGSPRWASKTDVSDGERWRAGQVQASITTRFVVRWSSFTAGLTALDRLICEGLEYDITGIKEIGGRRKFLELTAAARADLRNYPDEEPIAEPGAFGDGDWSLAAGDA